MKEVQWVGLRGQHPREKRDCHKTRGTRHRNYHVTWLRLADQNWRGCTVSYYFFLILVPGSKKQEESPVPHTYLLSKLRPSSRAKLLKLQFQFQIVFPVPNSVMKQCGIMPRLETVKGFWNHSDRDGFTIKCLIFFMYFWKVHLCLQGPFTTALFLNTHDRSSALQVLCPHSAREHCLELRWVTIAG